MLRLIRLPHIEPEVLGSVPDEDLNDLYDNAPCGYLSLLPDGRIYMVNTTFLRWTGYEREAIIGTYLRDLLHIGARIFYETHFAPLLRMQGYFNEVALDISKADGDRLPVLANAVERRDEDDDLLFTRVSLFQAADRRRYEREILELQAQTEAARKQLAKANEDLEDRVRALVEERLAAQKSILKEKEASELREHFISVLGHDLRNPLASIKSGLRMLAKEPVSDKAAAIMKLRDGSADRMANLISDVMDFARARLGGGMQIHRTDGSGLLSELRQVVEELRATYPHRQIEAEFDLADHVSCDPPRLGQMLSNLLGNAITHGAEDKPIVVKVARTHAKLALSVSNGGIPIPKHVQDRLFQPFFRGDASDRREGLGLGLYIASEIAKAHSGSLSVMSDDERTEFTFEMPHAAEQGELR